MIRKNWLSNESALPFPTAQATATNPHVSVPAANRPADIARLFMEPHDMCPLRMRQLKRSSLVFCHKHLNPLCDGDSLCGWNTMNCDSCSSGRLACNCSG